MRKFTLLFLVLFLGLVSFAQDTIRVTPDYTNGGALNKAITDNGPNKVYLLEANGFYTLTSTIELLGDSLNPAYGYEIVGEIPTGEDYMPVVQTGLTAENTPFTNMFTVKADVTFKNIFIANQTTTGQIGDYVFLIRDKARLEMDACVVDPVGRTDFINGGDFSIGSDIILTNNQFLRQGDPYSPGGGHMIRDVYADSVYIENNSFISTDHTIFMGGNDEKKTNFFWFNHNTVVWHDVGLKSNYSQPIEYVNNNLFYDLTTYVQLHGWNGDPDKGNGSYANIMLIDTASVGGGLEPLPSSRTSKWDRNSLFVSDAVKDILLGHAVNHPTDELWLYPIIWNDDVPEYFITDWAAKGQAILDASREEKMFKSSDFPNFVESNTWYDKNPNFVDSRIATHSVDVAKSALWWYYGANLLDGENSGTQKSQFWDVDGWAGTSDAMYPTVWPRWDGAYTNAELLTASTGGYPIGDLNAFPEEKAKWEPEKDALMEKIIALEREQEGPKADTIRVAPDYENGGALNKAIEENGANKVYVLEANGFYTLTSTIEILRDSLNPAHGYEILGETPTGDEYMPVLQTGLTAENTPFTNMFTVKADVTFKNIFIANQTTTGQIGDYVFLIRDKARLEMDACVVDPVGRIDFINGGDFSIGSDIILTNNQFLRQGDPYSPGGGHMIRDVYADSVYIENNSFISTDHTIFMGGNDEKKTNFFWFNHNTVVWHDVGLKSNYSQPNAYVNNNLFYDLTTYVQLHGWNGDPDKGNGSYANIMLIDTASVGGGLESLPSSRTIMWDRNSLFVSDAVKDVLLGHAVNHETDELWLYPVMWNEEVPHYFITDWDEKGQAILDASREAKMFNSNDFPDFVENNTWYDKNPNFVDSRIETHSVDVAKSALWWYYGANLLDGVNSGTQKSQFWDVDGWAGTSDAMYPTVWPRWDGAYTNEALLDASTGGYPLGDLNAFPGEKTKWKTEKGAIMETILSLETVDHILTAVNETELDVEEAFNMYPNPVSGVLTINSKSEIKSLKIYSITGQLLKIKEINDRTVNLDVSGLSKGIYIVDAEYKQGGRFTSKLVKE